MQLAMRASAVPPTKRCTCKPSGIRSLWDIYILPHLVNVGLFAEFTDHDALLMADSDRLYHKESFERFVEKIRNLDRETSEFSLSLYEAIGHRRIAPVVWGKIFTTLLPMTAATAVKSIPKVSEIKKRGRVT
jgi:hypothetical protein